MLDAKVDAADARRAKRFGIVGWSTARYVGVAAAIVGAVMKIRAAGFGAVSALGWALLAAGCGSNSATRDYNLVYTEVDPLEYARILCSGIDMQGRHTCLTSVMQHNKESRDRDLPPDEVVNGPCIVLLQDNLYRGTYVSQPFAAAFSVSNGINVCRGRYNAFAGDTKAIFKVICDDGSLGSANIMLDTGGRNGVGEVTMDDGTRGQIVFGYAADGGAFL